MAGDQSNIVLIHSKTPKALKSPSPGAVMPGTLIDRIEFTKPATEQASAQTSAFMVGAEGKVGKLDKSKPLNLITHRALAVKLKVDGPLSKPGEPCAVLNVQLESSGKTYRDHYIDLDFTGERTIIIAESNTERMLREFRPAPGNYAFKAAMYNFDYKNIVALNLRWMRQPVGKQVECSISLVEALSEMESVLDKPEISVGGSKIVLPVKLQAEDYAEYWGDGQMRVFNRNGVQLSAVEMPQLPILLSGENKVSISNIGPASAKLTTILLGDALLF